MTDLTRQYEMVCCNDVLEHVELRYLDPSYDTLNPTCRKIYRLRIDTVPAKDFRPTAEMPYLILQKT